MDALIFVAPHRLEWQSRADLKVDGPLEAIVRPVASSACDLDRRIIAGVTPFAPPFPLGHEAVAEVLDVGTGVRRVVPGDLVVVPWHISCGLCPPCRNGLSAHCTAMPGLTGYGVSIGGDFGGLFSSEVRVPFADAMLEPLPAGVDPIAAASASDNLTDAYIAVAKGLARHPGAPVLVVSSIDSMGLFAVEHAIASGAWSVDFVDQDERRREEARRIGASVHAVITESMHRRFPVVIGATRRPEELKAAMLSLAPNGHLANVAIVFGDIPVPMWDLYLRDATMSGGLPSVTQHIPHVLRSVACGHIHPERLARVIDWRDAPEALLEPAFKPVVVRDRLRPAA